jgi:hypothetical protein
MTTPPQKRSRDGPFEKTCYNCKSPGHNVGACEFICTRKECVVKPGVSSHMGKDCSVYAARRGQSSQPLKRKVFMKQKNFN